jgi:hypothetical protein
MTHSRLALPDKVGISSRIHVTTLAVDDDFDDLSLLLARARQLPGMTRQIEERARILRAGLQASCAAGKLTAPELGRRARTIQAKADRFECMQAIRQGRLDVAKVVQVDAGENMILRGFWEDLFARFASGNSAGANQTLKIKYLALGQSYAAISFTQTDLQNESYRDVPDETYDDGVSTYYTTLYTKKSEANPTGNTTVSSSTTTAITVASGSGFAVDNRIQVVTQNNTYTATVTGISGGSSNILAVNNITGGSLSGAAAFSVSDTPQASDTVKVLISEGGAIISDDATSTPGTGKAMNRRLLETLKTTSLSLLFDYIFAGASLP